ncbi:MAG TPA: ZTL protein [Thermoanaerobaculia bacterium]
MANADAWRLGRALLERAIHERLDFAFETTLGGNTIPRLLGHAAKSRIEVLVWYVGLKSPELHIERVAARVRRGGHPIPEDLIRRRYERSRLNLVQLLPSLTALHVYDNSDDADPEAGGLPAPRLVLHLGGDASLVRRIFHKRRTGAKSISRPLSTETWADPKSTPGRRQRVNRLPRYG